MSKETMAARDYAHAVTMARRAGHDKALATTADEFQRALRREDHWNAKAREAAGRFMAAKPEE